MGKCDHPRAIRPMKSYNLSTLHSRTPFREKRSQKGFTLIEVLVAMTLASLLISALFPTLVAGMLLTRKSCATNVLTNDIRHAYEHIAKNINTANATPSLTDYNLDNTGAARANYFMTVGLPGIAANNILPDDSSITVTLDGTCHPKIGDLVQITGLGLGDGLAVTALQDNRSATNFSDYTSSTNVTLKFANSIRSSFPDVATKISAGSSVTIIRKSAYAVITTEGENRLVWYEHADDTTTPQLVAHGISDSSLKPFSIVNDRLAINLTTEDSHSPTGFSMGANKLAYSRAGLKGELMFKSGNPFALVPPPPVPPPVEPPVKTTDIASGGTPTTPPATVTPPKAASIIVSPSKTTTSANTTPTVAPPSPLKVDW